MSALERLFLLEIEFHRRLRTEELGSYGNSNGVGTSYALQFGYEGLVREVGTVGSQDN